MKRVIQVAWFAIRAVYDEMFPLVGMGVIWFLASVAAPYGLFALTSLISPVAGLIGLLLGVLILVPPLTGGLYSVAVEIAHERRVEFGYFWQGIRSYARLSWALGAIVVASGVILAVDVIFYLSSDNVVFAAIGFLGLWALLFWIAVQIYLFPLMIVITHEEKHQEKKPIKLILKNASLLTLAYPFFALGILIVSLLATALSVALLLILLATIWMPFVAVLYSRATVSSLREAEAFQQRQAEIEKEQEQEE
jgi:hypothetical protein